MILRKAISLVTNRLIFKRHVSIHVRPPISMMDDKVDIKVQELSPNQEITLKMTQSNGTNLNFQSQTNYRADADGVVDLNTAAPLGHPYYDEPDPMGPFWSANPLEGSDKRFWSSNVMDGIKCDLEVNEGSTLLAATSCHRQFVSPGTKRVEVKDGRVRGTLFLPPGEGPFPAVIFMYGGILRGKVIEDKAALLSSHGFVTMSLAFFGVDDEVLPRKYGMIPLNLDICEEAVDYLLALKEVKKDKGVGLCGISKGGEVVLSMGAFLPDSKVSAVIALNSMVNYFMTDVQYKGQTVLKGHTLELDKIMENIVHLGNDLINIKFLFDSLSYEGAESTIPFHLKPNINYLLVGGVDDQNSDSIRALDYAKVLIKEAGHSKTEVQVYEDLGHLCDLPYSPVAVLANHALFPKPTMLQMGGDRRPGHVKAQTDIWHDTIAFFKEKL